MNTKLAATAVETYFAELRRVRASGGATKELSTYGPLTGLLDAVGATLKPKVFCVGQLAEQGAGHPDFGLYTATQVQKGCPRPGQVPERGVVEVKSAEEDAWSIANGEQVSRYLHRYKLVLVTNCRDFVLVAEDVTGTRLEQSFCLAESIEEFAKLLEKPRAFARAVGARLVEFLARALSHRATLAEPRDLARLLASYARDGLARVEAAKDVSSLAVVRSALEEALGARFEGESGAHFFRSTLVQTLFYGVFSAWVLFARRTPQPTGAFRWREAVWELRAPVLAELFYQLSQPDRLQKLGLVEVLDQTAAALDRVDTASFFSHFDEGTAVPYFYEPFLEAFDPDLRKRLGVWYTPTEVVRYMVTRVDRALRDDLGIAEGLAADNVYVLDPCCGTGTYLMEVLRRIADNLKEAGIGALAGTRLKTAALNRVFGFELMPAPFVVAHLQVELALQELDAPLAEGEARAPIFLTNALTGWEPRIMKPLPFPKLEEERERAEHVKQEVPILVVIGNPPYNGLAGVAVDEERDLSDAYRKTKQVRKPEGQGLNDLYVRFFRMAERRIADKTGCGVICFISNYSWLDGLSFTGMRERYLEAFDAIRVDCLNGDKYRTGKVAPDGSPDPSVFSTDSDPVGIQVGTAVTTLVRKAEHTSAQAVGFRHLWGQSKLADLEATAEEVPEVIYDDIAPPVKLGLPFAPTEVNDDWFDWPLLPDLFPTSFPGVNTGRDGFLVDIDLDRLRARVTEYFDTGLSHEEIARRYPVVMKTTAHFDARKTRDDLLAKGGPDNDGFIRFTHRPFDNRWLYWEADTNLLNRKRANYKPHIFAGNLWLSAAQHLRQSAMEAQAFSTQHIASMHLIERGASMFPVWLLEGADRRPNLTGKALRYLDRLGLGAEDLFHFVLATLHDPDYREANAGALRLEWPRIPIPDWPDGAKLNSADLLAASAERGRTLAALLNPEIPVAGVTHTPLRSWAAVIAVPATADGRNMADDDFSLTVGWGHVGAGGAIMPGQGRVVERGFTPEERGTLGDMLPALGETTFDVHLNNIAFWRNVPAAIWRYKLGGYQVLKKWLSYREHSVLGRQLLDEEVHCFTDTARRIGAMLC